MTKNGTLDGPALRKVTNVHTISVFLHLLVFNLGARMSGKNRIVAY